MPQSLSYPYLWKVIRYGKEKSPSTLRVKLKRAGKAVFLSQHKVCHQDMSNIFSISSYLFTGNLPLTSTTWVPAQDTFLDVCQAFDLVSYGFWPLNTAPLGNLAIREGELLLYQLSWSRKSSLLAVSSNFISQYFVGQWKLLGCELKGKIWFSGSSTNALAPNVLFK